MNWQPVIAAGCFETARAQYLGCNIRYSGDGLTMFMNKPLTLDEGLTDYVVVAVVDRS